MAVFAFRMEQSPEAARYVWSVNQRLGGKDFVKNPFRGYVRALREGYYVVLLTPLWPPVFLFGAFPLFAGLVFEWWWLVIVGLLFLSLGFFWSAPFFALLMGLGARKAGARGFRLVGLKKAIGVFLGGAA